MLDAPATSQMIGDRYLASPSALRARPMGPVDALDTRSGRAAQVRVLFVTDRWEPDALSEAVSRWCGVGAGEVCGVLDFGRSDHHWFVVLPPSLGVPLDRWRAMRRPPPGDAARLALEFGRLVERVVAAGFDADLCQLGDFSVGPGPVPFLERPLLDRPDAPPLPAGSGQRLLAGLLASLCAVEALPPALAEWRSQAAETGFATLGGCLDELELVGTQVRGDEAAANGEPLGLAGLFHDDREPPLPLPSTSRIPRAALVAGSLLGLLVAAIVAGHLLRRPAAAAVPVKPHVERPVTAPVTVAAPRPSDAKPPPARTAHHHRARRRAHPGARSTTAAPAAPTPATPTPTASPATSPPPVSAPSLPAPGGVSSLPGP